MRPLIIATAGIKNCALIQALLAASEVHKELPFPVVVVEIKATETNVNLVELLDVKRFKIPSFAEQKRVLNSPDWRPFKRQRENRYQSQLRARLK